MTPREQLLDDAQQLIAGHRDKEYGSPTDNFARAAQTLSALGYRAPHGGDILPHDVAIMMLAVKLCRLAFDPANQDTWMDVAGYAGCGWECAPRAHKTKENEWVSGRQLRRLFSRRRR